MNRRRTDPGEKASVNGLERRGRRAWLTCLERGF